MRIFKIQICISLLLLSCTSNNKAQCQPEVREKECVISVVSSFNHFYNIEDYNEIGKLYLEHLVDKKANVEISSIWSDRFELGKLKKSKLVYYSKALASYRKLHAMYDLEVVNHYERCVLRVHFKLAKGLNDRIRIVEYRLIFI